MLAEELLRSRPHGDREVLDLLPGVVVVELPADAGALPLEQVREGIAERRLAAVADMERTGRVRRHELDQHALACPFAAAPEGIAFLQDAAHDALARIGPEEDVDEAGAGDLRALDERQWRQGGDELPGDVARAALQALRLLQRDVGRVVAVLRLLRALEHDRLGVVAGNRSRESAGKPRPELGLDVIHDDARRIIAAGEG